MTNYFLVRFLPIAEKMSENENKSGHILLSKVQYFVTLSVCILTAETATRAKLSLVDTLIVFLHKKVDYGVLIMIFNAFVSIVHNTLYKTFFLYDIEGSLLGVIEIS